MLLIGIMGVEAQNANRSGIFLELSGGPSIGKTFTSSDARINSKDVDINCFYKGGIDVNFSFGYRYAVSEHWAVGLSAGAEGNLKIITEEFIFPKAMLVGRWTSNDFGQGLSFYLQPQAGFASSIVGSNSTRLPLGFELGLNFTNHFYGGFDLQYNIVLDKGWHYKDIYQGDKEVGEVHFNSNSHMTARLKFGYRF